MSKVGRGFSLRWIICWGWVIFFPLFLGQLYTGGDIWCEPQLFDILGITFLWPTEGLILAGLLIALGSNVGHDAID